MEDHVRHFRSSRRSFVQQTLTASGTLLVHRAVAAEAPAEAGQQASTGPRPRAAGERFRQLLAGPDALQCPVIYDVMSAKLSAQLGFPAIFAGGQTVSASMYGLGDFGTLTMTELIEFAGRVADAVDIAVVGDADDGGGNPLNVYRTIQRYERAGVACVMIEDMYGAKHLPSMPEGPMTPIPAFVDKVRAAVDARKDGLVLLARSDALSAKEPFESR